MFRKSIVAALTIGLLGSIAAFASPAPAALESPVVYSLWHPGLCDDGKLFGLGGRQTPMITAYAPHQWANYDTSRRRPAQQVSWQAFLYRWDGSVYRFYDRSPIFHGWARNQASNGVVDPANTFTYAYGTRLFTGTLGSGSAYLQNIGNYNFRVEYTGTYRLAYKLNWKANAFGRGTELRRIVPMKVEYQDGLSLDCTITN